MIYNRVLRICITLGPDDHIGARLLFTTCINNTGIGEKLVTLLWGGYFVSQAALKSLFRFHSLFFTVYFNRIMFSYIYYYYMKYHSSIPLRLNFTVESN